MLESLRPMNITCPACATQHGVDTLVDSVLYISFSSELCFLIHILNHQKQAYGSVRGSQQRMAHPRKAHCSFDNVQIPLGSLLYSVKAVSFEEVAVSHNLLSKVAVLKLS